ncbi:MAG: hypothetical protein ACOYNN_14520, partial [Terrimicrobiaceae bacterium]
VAALTSLLPSTYTVATLPNTDLVPGMRANVSDASTTTFYANVVSGSSSNNFYVPVFYDGSRWLIG